MAGHAQLKFVMTECSKTQIRLTGLTWYVCIKPLFLDSRLNNFWEQCDTNGYIIAIRYWRERKGNIKELTRVTSLIYVYMIYQAIVHACIKCQLSTRPHSFWGQCDDIFKYVLIAEEKKRRQTKRKYCDKGMNDYRQPDSGMYTRYIDPSSPYVPSFTCVPHSPW